MSFATVQKTIELIFSLFPFCAIIVHPNANYIKKSAWGGLSVRLVKSLTVILCFQRCCQSFCLLSEHCCRIHDILSLYYIFTVNVEKVFQRLL